MRGATSPMGAIVLVIAAALVTSCSTTKAQRGPDFIEATLAAPQDRVKAAVIQVLTEGGYTIRSGDEQGRVVSAGYRQEIDSIWNWLLNFRFGVSRSQVEATLAGDVGGGLGGLELRRRFRKVRQTSSGLWRLRSAFSETMASDRYGGLNVESCVSCVDRVIASVATDAARERRSAPADLNPQSSVLIRLLPLPSPARTAPPCGRVSVGQCLESWRRGPCSPRSHAAPS